MKKMQWGRIKKTVIIFSLAILIIAPVYSQVSGHRLQQADSLFNAKQFTQSLAHYEKILKNNEFTPAMLLKMAFVEEGMNKIGSALYYLNLYYLATNDESVLEKMDQLSKKYSLSGYDLDETEQALSFYRRHSEEISLVLGVIMLFLLSLGLFLKRKQQSPVPVIITLLVIATLFGLHVNLSDPEVKAIVATNNSYVMEGPANAAPVVAVLQGGHRFTVLGKKDIWVKINWNGRTAFIKEDLLLPVRL